jgi:chromate transporter
VTPTIEPGERARPSLVQLARVALWIGLVTFGGGYVVVGRIKRAFVEERRWTSADFFVSNVAVASALPGTISSNLFTLLAFRLRGVAGALTVSLAFLAPSLTLMIGFGVFHERLRTVATLSAVFDGMSAAVVGVIAAVAWDLRRTAILSPRHGLVAVLALAALVTRALTLLEVVVIAGAVGVFAFRPADPPIVPRAPMVLAGTTLSKSTLGALAASSAAVVGAAPLVLTLLFVFAKIGLVTFGGGYAMVPAMAHEVHGRGWLDDRAFGDAIALGQVTPGPISVCATFIGYRVAGLAGAAAATVGVFAPPFVVAILAARSIDTFSESRILQGFLRGISSAVVGIVLAASYALLRISVHGGLALGMAAVALVVRIAAPKLSPVLILLAAAAVSVLVHGFPVH